ncbi:MAG TPA: hypothetical protein VES01_04770 [Dermatophilaceae bacterium]|nr:hypothetical protein [Dermatophilaceae bacterium]
MRIIGSSGTQHAAAGTRTDPAHRSVAPRATTTGKVGGTTSLVSGPPRSSVMNYVRYLTESDKDLLQHATGELVQPGMSDQSRAARAFAQQLALDRCTGELAPDQQVTAVYLRNAAVAIDALNQGRAGLSNPYSGEAMDAAVAHLESVSRGRADLRR